MCPRVIAGIGNEWLHLTPSLPSWSLFVVIHKLTFTLRPIAPEILPENKYVDNNTGVPYRSLARISKISDFEHIKHAVTLNI